jgi:hypothetical protein
MRSSCSSIEADTSPQIRNVLPLAKLNSAAHRLFIGAANLTSSNSIAAGWAGDSLAWLTHRQMDISDTRCSVLNFRSDRPDS